MSIGPPPAVRIGPSTRGFTRRATPTILRLYANGYRRKRSGEMAIVPLGSSYIAGGYTHNGPWRFIQRVPLLLYGPGYIRTGTYTTPATLADIAPTLGRLVGYPFHTPDGHVLSKALLPGRRPPRLVITVVWDAGGLDVLHASPHAWPHLRTIRARGAWFSSATVGQVPSVTAPDHAVIGTGRFSYANGVVDNTMRFEGEVNRAWHWGPSVLRSPTLADRYDRASDNRALIGKIGGSAWQLGMIGHGASFAGGDRDLATTEDRPGRIDLHGLFGRYYRAPAFLNDVRITRRDRRTADLIDGRLDGTWRGYSLRTMVSSYDTPARLPYETRLIERLIAAKGFGRDAVPDLLYVNYKIIDHIGHRYAAQSEQMRDTVEIQDRQLIELVRFLNERVGRRRWVLVLTADHGAWPSVDLGRRIGPWVLEDQVDARFGSVVEYVDGATMYLRSSALRQAGTSVAEVVRYLNDVGFGGLGFRVIASSRLGRQ